MSAAGQVLGAWLTPVLWLSMPALLVERGPDGLWICLVLVVVPLIALGMGPPQLASATPESSFSVMVLLCTVGILFWANMLLAGNVATWLGFPRWYGIAVAAAGGCLLTAWRGAWRLVPALLLVAALAVQGPLIELGRAAGTGPIGAWAKVAAEPAFRFPATSPWVTHGLDLGSVNGGRGIRFDEEHRITVPSGGKLSARTADGGRVEAREWTLAAGESVVLRPGDLLQHALAARVQFEQNKRVPGSPVSGVSWAAGRPPDWPRWGGVLVTLLFGAMALCRPRRPVGAPRPTVAVVALGGLVALLWAQSWSVYSLLVSPDVLLGTVTPDRLLALPVFHDDAAGSLLEGLLVVGALASFLGSSVVLRERLAELDATGGGEIGRDLGVWVGVFVMAGLAAVWRLDCWSLALLALGAAGSSVGAVQLGGGSVVRPGMATLAGSVGLLVFCALVAADYMRPEAQGMLGALLAYPALAAVPAAVLTLRVCRMAAAPR